MMPLLIADKYRNDRNLLNELSGHAERYSSFEETNLMNLRVYINTHTHTRVYVYVASPV